MANLKTIEFNAIQPKLAIIFNTDEKQRNFYKMISLWVTRDKKIAESTQESVINSLIVAETWGLSPIPSDGHILLVPYWNKELGVYETFCQKGYKGLLQQALRAEEFEYLRIIDIFADDEVIQTISGFDVKFGASKKDLKTDLVGFLGAFKTTKGYKREIYMSKEEVFGRIPELNKKNRLWFHEWFKFDMFHKTVLNNLLKFSKINLPKEEIPYFDDNYEVQTTDEINEKDMLQPSEKVDEDSGEITFI